MVRVTRPKSCLVCFLWRHSPIPPYTCSWSCALPELNDWQLGRRIELLRTVRGWRQADLGNAAGISRSRICLIEAGSASTVRSMRQIAAAFGISLSSLLDTNLPVLTLEPKPPRCSPAEKSA